MRPKRTLPQGRNPPPTVPKRRYMAGLRAIDGPRYVRAKRQDFAALSVLTATMGRWLRNLSQKTGGSDRRTHADGLYGRATLRTGRANVRRLTGRRRHVPTCDSQHSISNPAGSAMALRAVLPSGTVRDKCHLPNGLLVIEPLVRCATKNACAHLIYIFLGIHRVRLDWYIRCSVSKMDDEFPHTGPAESGRVHTVTEPVTLTAHRQWADAPVCRGVIVDVSS
jgi:hypothetical protein